MAGEQGQAVAEALSIAGLEGSRRLWVLMRRLFATVMRAEESDSRRRGVLWTHVRTGAHERAAWSGCIRL